MFDYLQGKDTRKIEVIKLKIKVPVRRIINIITLNS